MCKINSAQHCTKHKTKIRTQTVQVTSLGAAFETVGTGDCTSQINMPVRKNIFLVTNWSTNQLFKTTAALFQQQNT